MPATKKLFFALGLLILGVVLLLGKQIQRSLTITTAPTLQPILSPYTTDIPVDVADPILGNPGAPLSLVAFMDIGCAECKKLHRTLVDFVNRHPEDARLIWKDAPEQTLFIKDTVPAHTAAYCASKQGKFWAYLDVIMADKKYRSQNDLAAAAEALKLDIGAWQTCLKNPATEPRIQAGRVLAQQLGATKVPVIFVNNKRLTLTEDINVNELLEAFIAP